MNVLTGSTTNYYQDKPHIWNNVYNNYVRYNSRPKQPKPVSSLRQAALKLTSAVDHKPSVSGSEVFIGDRVRDIDLRRDVLHQMNQHTSMIASLKASLMQRTVEA